MSFEYRRLVTYYLGSRAEARVTSPGKHIEFAVTLASLYLTITQRVRYEYVCLSVTSSPADFAATTVTSGRLLGGQLPNGLTHRFQ